MSDLGENVTWGDLKKIRVYVPMVFDECKITCIRKHGPHVWSGLPGDRKIAAVGSKEAESFQDICWCVESPIISSLKYILKYIVK